MESTEFLINEVLRDVKKNLEQKLQTCENDHTEVLSDVLDQSNKVFDGLKSEFLQQAFIKQSFDYVPYREELLGKTIVSRKKKNKVVLSEETETFIYIPILDSLKQLLGNNRIRDLILRPVKLLSDGVYYDICDGSVFKSDKYFIDHPDALQIILYHDEVEVCNPLGNKAGVHKLDMYYYSIANVDPRYRSKHCAIRLLALVNAKLIKKYGINRILTPIVQDLKELHNGVTLKVRDREIPVRGKVVLCAGDTLGQHIWGGFKEGVGFSFQKCRTCYCHYEDMQCCFDESDFILRSKESHNLQCKYIEESSDSIKSNAQTIYGINNRSILSELPGFDITKQLPQDIMHTILEGVLQYETRLVLLHFIIEKKVSLSELNALIANHDYGYSEISDKPGPLRDSVFSSSEKYKLKYKAAQSRLFLRLLPFFLTHFISVDNEYFQFLMVLSQIVQIIYAPVIKRDSIQNLKELISEHLSHFKAIFPENSIIPKQHYLIHIPTMITLNGPLIRSSCFAFESAHIYFKRLAQNQSFKNLNVSLAKRHQLLECSYFGDSNENPSSHPLFSTEFQHGVSLKVTNEMENHIKSLLAKSQCLPGIEVNYLHRMSWVVMYGTKYLRDGFLAVSATQFRLLPIFGLIEEIWLIHGYIYFEVNVYETICFEQNVQAYLVKATTETRLSSYESLVDFNVFHLKKDFTGNLYLPVKYNIDDIVEEHILGDNPLHF